MSITVDTSEVREFAVSLAGAATRIDKAARAVVSKGALNIKNQQQAEARASTYFKGFASAISYSMKGNAFYSEAEIGPVKGAPGSLANIAYFGTSRGGGTVADPSKALQAEAPRFEKALLDVMSEAVQ